MGPYTSMLPGIILMMPPVMSTRQTSDLEEGFSELEGSPSDIYRIREGNNGEAVAEEFISESDFSDEESGGRLSECTHHKAQLVGRFGPNTGQGVARKGIRHMKIEKQAEEGGIKPLVDSPCGRFQHGKSRSFGMALEAILAH
ncbi:hypothetical protein ACLOJK_005089 [Asimina triloba]